MNNRSKKSQAKRILGQTNVLKKSTASLKFVQKDIIQMKYGITQKQNKKSNFMGELFHNNEQKIYIAFFVFIVTFFSSFLIIKPAYSLLLSFSLAFLTLFLYQKKHSYTLKQEKNYFQMNDIFFQYESIMVGDIKKWMVIINEDIQKINHYRLSLEDSIYIESIINIHIPEIFKQLKPVVWDTSAQEKTIESLKIFECKLQDILHNHKENNLQKLEIKKRVIEEKSSF